MRKTKKTLNIIFDELEKTGLISSACAKAQIPRSTFYRWYNSDFEFRLKVDDTVTIGRANMVDFAESKVIKNIQNGSQRAAEFYLRHNDTRYKSSYSREFTQQVDQLRDKYRQEFESITAIRSALFDALPLEVLEKFVLYAKTDKDIPTDSRDILSQQAIEKEALRITGLKYYESVMEKLKSTEAADIAKKLSDESTS
jgi:hypothetical protein